MEAEIHQPRICLPRMATWAVTYAPASPGIWVDMLRASNNDNTSFTFEGLHFNQGEFGELRLVSFLA